MAGRMLRARKLLEQSVQAGVLYGLGDGLAQTIEQRVNGKKLEDVQIVKERTARMATFGFFVAGPLLPLWYGQLHAMTGIYRRKFVEVKTSTTSSCLKGALEGTYRSQALTAGADSMKAVGIKVMMDCTLFQAPFLNLFFLLMSLMEGSSLQQAYDRCKKDFHDIWGIGILFWTPVQCFNFRFVPAAYTALFVNVFNTVWKAIMSVAFHCYRDHDGALPKPTAYVQLASSTGSLAPPNWREALDQWRLLNARGMAACSEAGMVTVPQVMVENLERIVDEQHLALEAQNIQLKELNEVIRRQQAELKKIRAAIDVEAEEEPALH